VVVELSLRCLGVMAAAVALAALSCGRSVDGGGSSAAPRMNVAMGGSPEVVADSGGVMESGGAPPSLGGASGSGGAAGRGVNVGAGGNAGLGGGGAGTLAGFGGGSTSGSGGIMPPSSCVPPPPVNSDPACNGLANPSGQQLDTLAGPCDHDVECTFLMQTGSSWDDCLQPPRPVYVELFCCGWGYSENRVCPKLREGDDARCMLPIDEYALCMIESLSCDVIYPTTGTESLVCCTGTGKSAPAWHRDGCSTLGG
jgi:hypothetical protein